MRRQNSLFLLLLTAILFSACGISQNSLPMATANDFNTLNYNMTILQTNPHSQIGEEFIFAPSIKSAWGIGNGQDISLKIFGLGFGAEFKQEAYSSKNFVLSFSGEGNFSFPMISPLFSKFAQGKLINQEFLDFTSNAFYYTGVNMNTGIIFDTFLIAFYFKGGYLDNAGFLPDMGSSNISTSFPGFIFQTSTAIFLKERRSSAYLNFEAGYIFRLNLLYISGSYAY